MAYNNSLDNPLYLCTPHTHTLLLPCQPWCSAGAGHQAVGGLAAGAAGRAGEGQPARAALAGHPLGPRWRPAGRGQHQVGLASYPGLPRMCSEIKRGEQCCSQRGSCKEQCFLRDQSIVVVLITFFRPHQRKIIYLRAEEHHSLAL